MNFGLLVCVFLHVFLTRVSLSVFGVLSLDCSEFVSTSAVNYLELDSSAYLDIGSVQAFRWLICIARGDVPCVSMFLCLFGICV